MASPKRPNILLLHSDQHRQDCTGYNGHPLLKTPNLDRLAREGTNFSQAYTPIPICSPARACLMTGQWPTQHGCLTIPSCEHYHPAVRVAPTLTEQLAAAGYWNGWVGKFHNEVEGGPTDYGVHEYAPNWPYKEWREKQGIPPLERHNGFFANADAACPADKSPLAWQADQVLRMLDEHHDGDQPWFIRWDPPEPHLPCNPSADFADLYDPADIAPWPSFPDPQENKPYPQQRQHKIWGTGGWSWERWAPTVAMYLGVITELDHNIGRILHWLEERGELDNTLIIYTSDHGDFCGGHGLIDKHFSMYDDIVRIPLVIRWPDNLPSDAVHESFVSNDIDLPRTILDAAGIKPPESFVGKNLLDLANGKDASPREDILVQYFGTESGMYTSRAVRDRRYKYVYNPLHVDEFYDIQEDPGEITNRIDDPALQDEIRRQKKRLIAWMEETGDKLLNRWTRTELEDAPSVAAAMEVNQ